MVGPISNNIPPVQIETDPAAQAKPAQPTTQPTVPVEQTVIITKDGKPLEQPASQDFDNSLSFPEAGGGGGTGTGTVSARGRAGARLGQGYTGTAESGSASVTLTTKQNRFDALKHISQRDNLSATADASDRNRCGPSCIVAGVMYAKGVDGLKTLVAAIKAEAQKNGTSLPNLAGIEEKLRSGNITRDDISKIQDSLYTTLQAKEGDSNPYLNNTTLSTFLLENSELKQMFDDNNMQIINVDTGDADDIGNHFVLKMTAPDGKAAVYDPGARGAGNQITTNTEMIGVYDTARSSTAYPPILEASNGNKYTVTKLHSHSNGSQAFEATHNGKTVIGLKQSSGSWQTKGIPEVGDKSSNGKVTLTSVSHDLSKITALDASTVIGSVEGTARHNGQDIQVKGELKGNGSWNVTQYRDPTTGEWKRVGGS